jgi:type III secretion protein D
VIKRDSQLDKPWPVVELHVRSGCHDGVTELLAYGNYSIGGSHEADIALADPILVEIEARVDIDAKGVRVESVGGDVVLGTTRVEPGTARVAEYPADLRISGICLHWTRLGRDRSRKHWPVRAIAGVAVLTAMLTVGAASVAPVSHEVLPGQVINTAVGCEPLCAGAPARGATDNEPRLFAVARHAEESRGVARPSASLGVSLPGAAGISIPAAADALRQRLASAGLTTIDVSVEPDAVVAKGSADPASVHDWYEAREWFDKTFGTAVVLTSQIETRTAQAITAPVSVQSIWAGKMPYVIDQRGQKYFEGSVVNDGWSIERIEQGRITLRRSAQVFVLRL